MSMNYSLATFLPDGDLGEATESFRKLSLDEATWTGLFGFETGLRIADALDRFSVRRISERRFDSSNLYFAVRNAFALVKGWPAIQVVKEIPIRYLSDATMIQHLSFGEWMSHRCIFSSLLPGRLNLIRSESYMFRYRQQIASLNVQYHLWNSFMETLLSIVACQIATHDKRFKERADESLAEIIALANLWVSLDGILPLGFSFLQPNLFVCISFS